MDHLFLEAVRDGLAVGAALVAFYGIYVVKCALGIDLFPNGGLHLPMPGIRTRMRAWRARRRLLEK